VSRISSAIEILLRLRAQGVREVEGTTEAIDDLTEATDDATESGRELDESGRTQSRGAQRLAANVKRLAAAYFGLATARKAIELSNRQEQAESRVLGILAAQLESRQEAAAETERLVALAGTLQRELKLFGDEEILEGFTEAAARAEDIRALLGDSERFLRAAGDLAAARGISFSQAAGLIARTLGGFAGELGEQLPALANALREFDESQRRAFLQRGGAIDIIEQTLGGTAAFVADTGSARQRAAINTFNDQLEQLGFVLTRLTNPPLIAAVAGLKLLADGIEDLADAAEETVGGAITAAGALIRAPFRSEEENNRVFNSLDVLLPDFSQRPSAAPSRAALANADRVESQQTARLLNAADRQQLEADLGLISDFEQRMIALRQRFDELAGDTGIFRDQGVFEAPADELEVFFNIAVARERAADATQALADAQAELRDRLEEISRRVEAGELPENRAIAQVQEAQEAFRLQLGVLQRNRAEIEAIVAGAIEAANASDAIDDIESTPEFLDALAEGLARAEAQADRFRTTTAGLSTELGEGLQAPLANAIQGQEDFGDALRRTIQDIAAQQAALKSLQAVFGGTGDRIGGGGLLGGAVDTLGGFLGFAEGGVVPGPDLGRDSTVIAARGGEGVLVPEVVRGRGDAIAHLNATGDWEAAAVMMRDAAARVMPPRIARGGLPGYAGGGLVDAVGALGERGGGGATVLPVALLGPDDYARAVEEDPTLLAEIMRRNRGLFQDAIGGER